MMMNRDRIGFWVRLVAILLAFFFVASFIFVGLGTNVSYNLFDLIGGQDQPPGGQTTDLQDRIEGAERELEENPKDPNAIKELAADRKSTRLNSSHANISYAVFCLKKKSRSVWTRV